MALLTSRDLSRPVSCPVCGKKAAACGDSHEGTRVIDIPEGSARMGRPDVVARRELNGSITDVLATRKEAEANGWEIVREIPGAGPSHKKVEPPAAPQPASPEPAEPVSDGNDEEDGPSYDDLYSKAKDLEIKGRSKMSKEQLVEAIAEAEAG